MVAIALESGARLHLPRARESPEITRKAARRRRREETDRQGPARVRAAQMVVSLFVDPISTSSQSPPRSARRSSSCTRAATPTRAARSASASSSDCARRPSSRASTVCASTRARLDYDNVAPVAALPHVEELNIGHAIVSTRWTVGARDAVRKMLAALGRRRAGGRR
jgi:pyridoxine 5-phosphate synthase